MEEDEGQSFRIRLHVPVLSWPEPIHRIILQFLANQNTHRQDYQISWHTHTHTFNEENLQQISGKKTEDTDRYTLRQSKPYKNRIQN
jgi:hypothetical protein